jgi:hypothetical protein
VPPNTLDEIRRDLARLTVVREQIEAIEHDRLARQQQAGCTATYWATRLPPEASARASACAIATGSSTSFGQIKVSVRKRP